MVSKPKVAHDKIPNCKKEFFKHTQMYVFKIFEADIIARYVNLAKDVQLRWV
jgi:hypothetical protein